MKLHTAADDFFRMRQRHWDEDEARRLAKGNEMQERIELGAKVKDKITGAEGTVVQRVEYLHGSTRVGLQRAGLDRDGHTHELMYLDEGQLETLPTS